MNEHVKAVIEELEERAAWYQDLIRRLKEFDDETTSSPPPAKLPAPRQPPPARPGQAKRIGREEAASFALTLPKRFTAADLAGAAGIKKSMAWDFINPWKERGWVSVVEKGVYERTKFFGDKQPQTPAEKPKVRPAKKTESPALNAPANKRPLTDAQRKDFEKQLADAKQQLAHCKTTGRSTMLDVFQKDVDRLEALLAEEGGE